MAVELILAPEAEADLNEACAWYEALAVGQGEDFLVRVDACLQAILRFPEMHPIIEGTFRCALVRISLRRVLRVR